MSVDSASAYVKAKHADVAAALERLTQATAITRDYFNDPTEFDMLVKRVEQDPYISESSELPFVKKLARAIQEHTSSVKQLETALNQVEQNLYREHDELAFLIGDLGT